MGVIYVLINCELGAEESIIEELKKIEDVKEAFGIFGTHDIMVKLESDNMVNLRETVKWKIQKMDKIRSTNTLVRK